MTTRNLERAVLAGGCFWGMQDLIRKLPGVVNTRVGYTGGDVPNATYRNQAPRRGHRDRVRSDTYQLSRPSGVLLPDSRSHTLNRQGNDVGASYRSEIFYISEAQRDEALGRSTMSTPRACGRPRCDEGLARRRVLGSRAGAPGLSRALPDGYTCHFPRPGWKLARRAGVAT